MLDGKVSNKERKKNKSKSYKLKRKRKRKRRTERLRRVNLMIGEKRRNNKILKSKERIENKKKRKDFSNQNQTPELTVCVLWYNHCKLLSLSCQKKSPSFGMRRT